MKMKQIAIVIAGVLLAAKTQSQEEVKSIPRMEQVREFSLITSHHTSWKVSVYPNGAALLLWGGIGSLGPFDEAGAVAPRGSCSFKEVYNLLTPRLKPFGSYGVDMTVRFRGVSTNDSCVHYLDNTEENKEIVRKLMRGLYRKVIPGYKEGFEKTLRERPFVQGDEPITYRYGEKADGTAFMAALEDLRPEIPDEDEKRVIDARLKILELAGHELPATDAGGVIPSNPEAAQPVVQPPPPGSEPPPSTSPYLLPSIAAALALCVGTALWLVRREK